MKKTLLALAVAASTLPLIAQAAPELYGQLNVSLSNVAAQPFADGAPFNTFGPTESSWNINSIQNWVGLRGEVPLYNQNLKAIYQIERGVDVTNGSGDLSARNTFVGLAGDSWGKVFFGNYDGVVKKAEGKVDQFNHTEADMALYIGGQNRHKNTVNYSSPSMSGLTFNAQIIPGEGSRQDATKDTIGNDPVTGFPLFPSEHGIADGYGASINFKQDTFWANLAWEKSAESALTGLSGYVKLFSLVAPPGTDVEALFDRLDIGVQTLRLTAGMNIGNINLALLAQQRKADDFLGGSTESKQDYLISGSLAATDRLTVKAQVADAAGAFLLKDDDRKVMSYTLGADYELGKNVTSYVLYSMNSIDGKNNATGLPVPTGKDDSEYNVASVGLTLKF